jgi:lysophospholipase L1-like esterase
VGAKDGRGYVVRLYERIARLRSLRLLNTCASGATSEDVVRRQLPRALAARPAIATVFIGINDLVLGATEASYGRNVEQIARELASHEVRALFCTIPDLAFAPAATYFMSALRMPREAFEARTRAFNARVVAAAREHGHRAHELFAISLADKAHFFSQDGFHPSAEGYQALADELWPSFETLAQIA